MNKNIGVTVGIILLILLGLGAAFALKRSPQVTTSDQTTSPNPTTSSTPTPAATQGTLKDIFSMTSPQTCTFVSPNSTTSGTIYTANKQLAGDFTSSNDNKNINGHIVVASGYVYIWTDAPKMGFKMPLAEAENAQEGNKQGLGINEPVSYNCSSWSVDTSKFELPKDVSFSTLNLPSGMPRPSSSYAPGDACKACDSLPAGAAQTTCKTQLHCL